MSGERNAKHSLDLTQRWFQEVITCVGGADSGISSPAAQECIRLDTSLVEQVIRRSVKLTSLERLSIYSGAYYARLLECLGGCFPVLKHALGDTLFDSFAIEYLQQYPSRSYTLDRLGEHFCAFLAATRPEPEEGGTANWPDFLIDLATLEWTIGRVFDGPGSEDQELLRPEMLQAVAPDHFADAQLKLVTGFELLAFRYPVSTYYTAARRAAETEVLAIPEPSPECVAVFRRDFVVRRYPITEPQFVLLRKLQSGATIGDAIIAAGDSIGITNDSFAAALQNWFRHWSQEGFFTSLIPPSSRMP